MTARGLTNPHEEWLLGGIPLISFMKIKEKSSYGIHRPVIPSFEVELHSKSFKTLEKMRSEWQLQDHYENSGPVQFAGPLEHLKTKKLTLEHLSY